MKQPPLLPKVREYVRQFLNGYVQHEAILQHLDDYIVLPGLGDNAGICEALA